MSEATSPTIGTSELATILGLTDSRIRQLERSGIIEKIGRGQYDLASAVQGYCKYLKESTSTPDGMSEKDLLDRTRRKKLELEISIIQGELHRADDVRRVTNDMLSAFRQRILSIPTKAAPRLIGITELAVIQDVIRKEVHEGLSELADYNPEAFYRQSKDKLVLDDGGAEHGKSEASRRVRAKK